MYYKAKIIQLPKHASIKYKISELYYQLKCFFQRGRNGYSHADVWDMNQWFLRTIPHMLNDLATNALGYPDTAGTYENWIDILNTMKTHFEKSRDNNDAEELKKGFELFVEYFGHLWD